MMKYSIIIAVSLVLSTTLVFAHDIDPETGFQWGKHNAPTGYISHFEHGTRIRSTRAAMSYALKLLSRSDEPSQKEGVRVLKNILKYQDSDPNSPTYGVWPWYVEEPFEQMLAVDYNWADFLGATLVTILTNYSDRLPDDVKAEAQAGLDRACACIKKRDVKPNYTNIAYLGAVVCAAGGELLNKPEYLEYAKMRMKRNIDNYKEIGGFTEYNSPTYTMVVLTEMERAAQYVKDEQFREMTENMRQEVWKMIATHFHAPTGQWSGPFSRTYRDLLSDEERNRILGRCGLLPKGSKVSHENGVRPLPCPPEFIEYFTKRFDESSIITANYNNARQNFRQTGTTYLDNELSLGTASYYSFWFQTRGLIAYWNDSKDNPVAFKQRFLHDDRDFASVAARTRQSGRNTLTAFNFLLERGSLQPGQDRPKDRTFLVSSFKIVYELIGSDQCIVRQLDDKRYEFSAGSVRAVVHLCDANRFLGNKIQWSIQNDSQNKHAALIGVCYEGPQKPFKMDELDEIRIAVGVEFLKGNEQPTDAPVTISDSDFTTKSEGAFYESKWKPVNTSDSPLLAPCKATKF